MNVRPERHPSIPYVVPFLGFIAFLAIRPILPFGPEVEYPLRVLVVSALLLLVSRPVLDLKPTHGLASILVGLGIFALWITPDLLFPEYRSHWLFSNGVTGKPESSIPPELRSNLAFLFFRVAGTAVLVPIVEELFWRGFLLRWLTRGDFRAVPLGDWVPSAFWITALLFASEHGPWWDVGLLTGIGFNYWLRRTRSLADCILAHAVANAALAAYVLGRGRWEYWL